MKKLVSFLLALVLVLSSVSALAAYNDHTDYVDWPIVKDGEKLTVSVATKRSEQYGKDPDQQWFWIWSETYSGIDFEVDQILSTAVDERKSLMFASGDLPDLLFGINLDTSELVRYGMGEGMLLDLTPLHHPGDHAQPVQVDRSLSRIHRLLHHPRRQDLHPARLL